MKKSKLKKGITLIEIIISMTIFVTVVIQISAFFVTSSKVNRDSKIKEQATRLAQEKMEELKFSSIPPDLQLPQYEEVNKDKAKVEKLYEIPNEYDSLKKSKASMKIYMELLKDKSGNYDAKKYKIEEESGGVTGVKPAVVVFLKDNEGNYAKTKGFNNTVSNFSGDIEFSEKNGKILVENSEILDLNSITNGEKNIFIYYNFEKADKKMILDFQSLNQNDLKIYLVNSINSSFKLQTEIKNGFTTIYENIMYYGDSQKSNEIIEELESQKLNEPQFWIYKVSVEILDEKNKSLVKIQGFRKVK